MSSQFSLTSDFTRVNTPLQLLVKSYLGSLVYPEMTVVLSWISVVAWDLGFHLARRLCCKRNESGVSEKRLISVKPQVCLSAYPEYLV